MPTLGEKIKELRKEKKLSQERFAEALNVSRQTVSNWETDEVIPNTDNLTTISKFLCVSLEYLTCTNGKENKEVAATTDTTIAKKKRPSVGWIIGIVLSSVIPVIDLIIILIYSITVLTPFVSSDYYSNDSMDWELFWILLALLFVSLSVLVTLIICRVKKHKKEKNAK